jgi:hypothetical protein
MAQLACHAQVTPPGLGKLNTANWFAVGLKQDLNHAGALTSTTFFGMGRTSNPDNLNPFERPAIYVVNQEIAYRFATHWQYAGAVSYRSQTLYESYVPYEVASPARKQELRVYGKYSYLTTYKQVNLEATVRPEWRMFYNPDLTRYKQPTQFRSRVKLKAVVNLDHSNRHRVIAGAEALFAASTYKQLDKLAYTESRFSIYYSITLPGQKITLDVGYMNNLIGKHVSKDVHYLAIDVILKNIFKT